MTGHVTIIGAGAAGVLVLLHLLGQRRTAQRITLIGDAEPGQGVAYGTRRPEHLLNVVAGRMSAFEDDPHHFVRYLRGQADHAGIADLATVFASRRSYAAYLKATLAAALAAAPEVQVLRDEAIELDAGGPLRLTLRSGRVLQPDRVVLATGNAPRRQLRALAREVPAERIVEGWDAEAIARIDADATLCIAGAGLSMVDAVLTRVACGHRGLIHVVSRHGLMPLPHAAHGQVPLDLEAFVQARLARRARQLRQQARACAAQGIPWQWLMDTLRPHNVRLWQTLTPADQRRFLRHGARFWDVHRHRVAPAVHATLRAMHASGQLRLQRGRLRAMAWTGAGCDLLTDRGPLAADWVIDCTGLETDLRRLTRPLPAALLRAGIVGPGAHGIGVETDAAGAVVGRNGTVDPRIGVIGSARIGQLWESVAIPELRLQAAALARGLLENV